MFAYTSLILFSMYCMNKKIDKFVELRVCIYENGKVYVRETDVIDKNVLNSLKKQYNKMTNGRHFKITAESGKLLTSTYVIIIDYFFL